MEPRVLVVSLFAPYSVNFDAGPKTPSSGGGASSVHERQIGRSGSTGRSAVWNGRRSSMHRTHTTPLGRHAEPHSRRRSTFSINAVKLAPISRNSSKTSDGGNATSPCDKPGAYLTPCNEGDGADPAEASNEGAAAADTSRITDKPGPSQLAYSIEEAAGAHTPSPNTLDFTRKLNIDQMREKQERKTGAGKHGRMLHNKLTKAEPDAEVRQTPPGGWYGSALATGADSTLARNIAAAVDDDGSGDMTPGPQIGTQLPKEPQTTLTDAVAAETDDPFTVEHLNVGNIGLFNAVNASLDLFAERVWIGELGITTEGWSEERKTAVSNRLLDEFETLPVFVSDTEFEGHYSRFSKQLIWPAFHYIMPEMPQWHGWEKSAYEAALATCERFADRIVDIYRDGDIIWVNDYHLMLLPKLIRERLPGAKIGFFLHIPFPSSEIFRCLHVRKELLEGMLGADVVGLQTFSYKRHLIQTAKRVLGVTGSPSGLTLDRGHVVVGQYAMGLDPVGVEGKWSNATVGELIEFLNEKYSGKYLLVGRDKLDHVKGVRQKLLGYECFLEANPEFAGKTVLTQIALTTAEHNELQVQVMDVVNRINSKFGNIEHQPVVFFHKDIPYSQYLALLSAADAMVITSLRDGMNLTSHEYVICQREKKSPLVLSEFVGTYGSFNGGALGVNPMDTRAIAQAIKDALVMSDEEKLARWNLLHRQVLTNSASSFVSSFISDIESAHAEAERH
ncbi:Trehalose-6-P synthase/phosphatase complex subunit [Coemansia sp. RSA 2523]|nr:Trehalose-6-P synthase/phosphatase complex subunit [Coemansia sp. RSA 1752]KAJ1779827.1 Trehalose-6-P synthase/phosphatase complex subunit [Coemansia sp. RSA 1824]KAJ1784936.1 Trehalose-6-P synthase/phosphatase complex subunit [Coemansia sp. RSA 1938]KAJ1810315.1 Trehalose-6-P synthase/phosphatase complex subunit [Coemansia sp. RSA 2523]KAJ2143706.1 Trehalose-6-P synthase/phosphatase complex subunit [Coemansia sp. RSA 564]KAJ2255906.1 Trehalose-6-P synthase/phosphatase complex subunit [Coem